MKLKLAILAQTKFGKSTTLALLSKSYAELLKICTQDGAGRTKVLTEYYYDLNNDNPEIWIKEIYYNEKECLGRFDADVCCYNDNLDKNSALRDGLGLRPLSAGENPKEYLDRTITNLCGENKIEKDTLQKLICTENLENFVRKIVLRVPASDMLKKMLNDDSIEFSICDTKGLMDLSLGETLEQHKQNLVSIGLDNLDGAIFGCNDSYSETIDKIYHDTLYSVFSSVPTFLIAKSLTLKGKADAKSINATDFKQVSDFLENCQTNDELIDSEEKYLLFNDTHKLFTALGVMVKSENSYTYKETYFDRNSTEFVLPLSVSLKKYGNSDIDGDALNSAKDFQLLKTAANVSISMIIEKIIKFKNLTNHLISNGGYANMYFHETLQRLIESKNDNGLLCDLESYCTKYYRPNITSLDNLNSDIIRKEYNILGNRNGITTRNNGSYRYATTAVVAVTARRWINHVISEIAIDADALKEFNTRNPDQRLTEDPDLFTRLIKNIIRNHLYENYTDTKATIQTYLCIDRCKVKEGIEKMRAYLAEHRSTSSADCCPFSHTIGIISGDFGNSLTKQS